MIDKVRKILGLRSRKTGNKLILSVEKLESRVALLENGRLEEYSVERKSSRNIVGSIYKGKVKNIEMGLKAMFVDIGFEKNAFLHFWDAIPAALDSGIEEIDRRTNKRPRKRITVKDIPSIYPVGSDVIVQVEITLKYSGYIERQEREIEKSRSLEGKRIPDLIDYNSILGLRTEARQKLAVIRPTTVGQALRISGVSPADVSLIMVWMKRASGDCEIDSDARPPKIP